MQLQADAVHDHVERRRHELQQLTDLFAKLATLHSARRRERFRKRVYAAVEDGVVDFEL